MITLIDLGYGNLGSIQSALNRLKRPFERISSPQEDPDRGPLLLPGVGHFHRAVRALDDLGWRSHLLTHVQRGRGLLGICLGMQLLAEGSEESPDDPGLGLVKGVARRLKAKPLPHIGWAAVEASPGCPRELKESPWLYFVHSYALPVGEATCLVARYGDVFSACIQQGSVMGFQAHPEKSGLEGLRMLDGALSLLEGKAPGPQSIAHLQVSEVQEGFRGGQADEEIRASQTRWPVKKGSRGFPGLQLIPSLDLMGGMVVRLREGDPSRRICYSEAPEDWIQRWVTAGARRIHVVDLDAALGGLSQQLYLEWPKRWPKVQFQMGGGLRSSEAVERVLDLGFEAVVGTLALENPQSLRGQDPKHLRLALDLKDGRAALRGWRACLDRDLEPLLKPILDLGIQKALVTDIRRDGGMEGPGLDAIRSIQNSGFTIQASGGVRGMEDFIRLAEIPAVEGAITGRALLEGHFDLTSPFVQGALAWEKQEEGSTKRILPCLDVRQGRVVKGIQFQGLKDMGCPALLGKRYDEEGADELVFLDISASQLGRGTRLEWVREVAENLSIPFTVGGGVASLQEVDALLRVGADKVAFNTAAVLNPRLIQDTAQAFGRQCVVAAVDVGRDPELGWRVFIHGGRTPTTLGALDWLRRLEDLGAGEILLTSMDRDGTGQGFDLELLRALKTLDIPLIASGGAGRMLDFLEALQAGADAVLAATLFHEGQIRIPSLRAYLRAAGMPLRPFPLGRDGESFTQADEKTTRSIPWVRDLQEGIPC